MHFLDIKDRISKFSDFVNYLIETKSFKSYLWYINKDINLKNKNGKKWLLGTSSVGIFALLSAPEIYAR